MATEQLSPTNWYQIVTCISVTITAAIAVTVFFWGLLPEESRYRWRLRLGILKPDLRIQVASQSKSPTQPSIFLVNGGPRLQSDIVLEVWDQPNYWTTQIWAERKNRLGELEGFEESANRTSRYGRFSFPPPDSGKQIGYLDPPVDQNKKWVQGLLKWRITTMGIVVKEGVTWLPEPPI